MKAKLFTRIMNAPMEWLPETIRGSKKAVTYNFINGTGKKGILKYIPSLTAMGN